MVIALPDARGLLSTLQQEAFWHEENGHSWLCLNKSVHGFLDGFFSLALDIASRPTRIAELIPDTIHATLGPCEDATGDGKGRIHFITTVDCTVIPVLWQHKFLDWIQRELVSFYNPLVPFHSSNLELADSIAHNDILTQKVNVWECTIHNSHDNIATVFWQRKGFTTITTGSAACLL